MFKKTKIKRMREGVYKDIERRVKKEADKLESEEKKLQNQRMLESQAKLQESLRNSSSKQ